MTEPLPPKTLAWLHQTAAVDGAAYSQVLLHLLERVEALEQESTCKQSLQVPPASEVAPVATDDGLVRCCAQGMEEAIKAGLGIDGAATTGLRAIYDLDRQYGAAQLPAAQPAPPAPEPGVMGELIAWLHDHALNCRELGRNDWAAQATSAATLLAQQAAPAPAVVPVAVSERLPEEGDCDAEGRCWLLHVDKIGLLEWHFLDRYPSLDSYSYYGYTHWLPAHAIPVPQGGEGEA